MRTRRTEPAATRNCSAPPSTEPLDSVWLKELAMRCGADDVGLVDAGRGALRAEAPGIDSLLPGARTVVSIAVRMNPDALRSPWMGVVNREAGFANRAVDEAASELSQSLLAAGVRSVAVPAAFPMDMQNWPGKLWPVSHKIIAEQAGLGRMGHHRLLIHPRFGTAVLLSAVIVDRPSSAYDAPSEENPCSGCKLCVAACPTGSIRPDGTFSFVNCATHNYRYRLGGFVDWAESLAESKSRRDYRNRVPDAETVSLWQALAYGTNYTCLNCLAVCPAAAECDVATEQERRAPRSAALAQALRARGGPVYVLRGSDAETHAEKTFPAERIRRVRGGTRPASARGFVQALPLVFQPGRARGLDATYHFDFTGADPCQATVVIRHQTLAVASELKGSPDLKVVTDGPTWVSFLAGETRLFPALLRRRIRIHGRPSLLKAFARCFPA
ncbi:MAG: 4Fe-4S ferredoxin [Deltaproteobacteria bacterium]|nr:4Fe-4S ferredoxin [Deltaproteobacteria bacterium]